jgi:hypothetical protein
MNANPALPGAALRPGAARSHSEISAFSRNVLAVLERTEYRRVEGGEDLEDIYRLRYKSYRAADMVSEIADQTVHDSLDDLDNCYRFGVYIDGNLVSTIRIHHVNKAHPVSPSVTVYGDILKPRIRAGDTFIDPSRFAADPEWSQIHPQIPYLTLRIAGMACFHFNAPYCLSTIQEDHTGFYRRIYMSEQIGGLRDYPGLNYPVVLYQANVHAIEERSFVRFPFFRSTRMEQRLLFDRPVTGARAPLTVLPTAGRSERAA